MTNTLEDQLALEAKLQIEAASSRGLCMKVLRPSLEKRKPNFQRELI